MTPQVIAAGAVVWRKNADESIEVALVHRPRYDDWSLPKGKLEVGETLVSCAYREVMEETNLPVRIGPYLGVTEYFVPDGLKQVHYWCAQALEGGYEFHPNDEVDQLLWLSTTDAIEKSTRESDREILAKFVTAPFDTNAFVMLRHAKALARQEWDGDDDDRPLDLVGQLQAKRMLSIYQVFGLEEIYTSDAVRCFDTVAALGKSLKIDVKVTQEISEYTFKKNKEKSRDFVKELMKKRETLLICSHNPVLPKMLEKLTKKTEVDYEASKLLPGESWVIHHNKKDVLQVDRLPAPQV